MVQCLDAEVGCQNFFRMEFTAGIWAVFFGLFAHSSKCLMLLAIYWIRSLDWSMLNYRFLSKFWWNLSKIGHNAKVIGGWFPDILFGFPF